jgi:hypothetical protein
MTTILALFLCMIIFMTSYTIAGLIQYGACQAGCAGIVVACYTGAGFVFGTVTMSEGMQIALSNCNKAFGKCSSICSSIT